MLRSVLYHSCWHVWMILWARVLFTYQNTFITLKIQLLHCKYKTALLVSRIVGSSVFGIILMTCTYKTRSRLMPKILSNMLFILMTCTCKTRSRLVPEILSSCYLYIQALVLVFVDGYCDFNFATLICTLIIERNQCSYFDHVLIPVIFWS